MVWMDEVSIQLETHRRFCCQKRQEAQVHVYNVHNVHAIVHTHVKSVVTQYNVVPTTHFVNFIVFML